MVTGYRREARTEQRMAALARSLALAHVLPPDDPGTRTPRRAAHTLIRAEWNAPLTALLHRQTRQITIWLRMMSNVNLRPIQHSAVNFGRFGLLRGALAVLLAGVLFVVSSAGFVYASLSSQFANRVVKIDDYASDEQNKATRTPSKAAPSISSWSAPTA